MGIVDNLKAEALGYSYAASQSGDRDDIHQASIRYAAVEEIERLQTAVRDWHPKCETCGHKVWAWAGAETDDDPRPIICGKLGGHRRRTDYCNEHTALRGEEE